MRLTAFTAQVKQGDVIELRLITYSEATYRLALGQPSSGKVRALAASTFTGGITNYVLLPQAWINHYYADAQLLSSSSSQYAAIASHDSTTLVQWRFGSAIMRYVKDRGLLWRGDGDATKGFFRVNPLVMVVRLTFLNNQYTAVAKYNPLNKSVSCQRTGQGTVTLTHNLACANLTFTGSGCSGQRAYIDFSVQTANQVTIKIGDDDTPNDYNVDVLIYDYGSY